jgi:hypothetical protein
VLGVSRPTLYNLVDRHGFKQSIVERRLTKEKGTA